MSHNHDPDLTQRVGDASLKASPKLDAALQRFGATSEASSEDCLRAGVRLLRNEGMDDFDPNNPADVLLAATYERAKEQCPSVMEVFRQGSHYDPQVQCHARDWYYVHRQTVPTPSKHKGLWIPCAHLFVLLDAVTQFHVAIDHLAEREPSAKHLIEQTKKGLDLHGLPRKGICIHPMMWASIDRVVQWPMGRLHDVESYLAMNADFEGMDVEQMVEFERWVISMGLRCSFGLAAISGGESIDARTAFESPL